MDKNYLSDLVKEFYTTPKEQGTALKILEGYKLDSSAASRLRELLQERQRLLDPQEPSFFDEAQLRAAAETSAGFFRLRPLNKKSNSGGRNPVLQRRAEEIGLEGFAESRDYEGNED